MARADKAAAVAEITEEFRASNAAVLTEYRGLTVGQLKELRRSLGANTTYAVVKNTLSKIAAKDAGVEGFENLLQGPTAIAFIKGDPIEAAKGLDKFANENPFLVIKGGIMDGNIISADDLKKLAKLESREVLLSKVAGVANAALAKAAALFQAPLSKTARTIAALEAKGGFAPVAASAEVIAPKVSAAAIEEPTSAADEVQVAQEVASEVTSAEEENAATETETPEG